MKYVPAFIFISNLPDTHGSGQFRRFPVVPFPPLQTIYSGETHFVATVSTVDGDDDDTDEDGIQHYDSIACGTPRSEQDHTHRQANGLEVDAEHAAKYATPLTNRKTPFHTAEIANHRLEIIERNLISDCVICMEGSFCYCTRPISSMPKQKYAIYRTCWCRLIAVCFVLFVLAALYAWVWNA